MPGNEEFRIVAPAHMGARVIRRAAELGLDVHQFTLIAWENQLASAELSKPTSNGRLDEKLAEPSAIEVESFTSHTSNGPWTGLTRAELLEIEPNFGKPIHMDKDKILWGQFNRFLPIKLTLRVLLAEGKGEPVKISLWQKPVRTHAATWREYLREIDVKLRIRRGSQLSSGFPKNQEKSFNRFNDHFTAVIQGTTAGPVVGMPAEMGFIEVNYQDQTVRLTQDGFEFAMLENPIIDGLEESKVALSEEERFWMKSHIQNQLTKEYRFMVNVLKAIDAGNDTPITLVDEMLKTYGPHSGRGWTKEQVSTYQGGALARMGSLGLIGRRWEYRRVHYEVTKAGIAFIKGV